MCQSLFHSVAVVGEAAANVPHMTHCTMHIWILMLRVSEHMSPDLLHSEK